MKVYQLNNGIKRKLYIEDDNGNLVCLVNKQVDELKKKLNQLDFNVSILERLMEEVENEN